MVVVAGRKPHVSNILGVSTGTLPVSVCLLPVPVSTLSYTTFHRSPTINSQRFALFDSTFSVRFKLISHSLSAPFPLPLRSARPKTCPLVSCASASASAAGRGPQRAQCIYRPEVKVHGLHTASCEFTTLVHQIKSTHPPPSRYYFSSQSPLNHEDPHTCAGGPSAVLCGTVWGYLSRVVATLAAMRHRGLSACSARGFW